MKQITYFSLVWLVSPKELSFMQSGLSQLCTVCGGKKECYINSCDISVLELTAYNKELEKCINKCFEYTKRILFTLYNQFIISTSHPHKPDPSSTVLPMDILHQFSTQNSVNSFFPTLHSYIQHIIISQISLT
jgi:hypothetical protein